VNLSAEDVREILRLLDAIDVDELHLETERFTLTLRRAADGAWTRREEVRSPPNLVTGPRPARDEVAAPGGAGPSPGREGLLEVRTPLPGTFYRAPRPGAPPFVDLGATVEPDAVVGIVETMKLMNPVLAGVRGTVVEICLADAEPVEQGSVLVRIEPERS
jgi:acetyl-CoA carboxylase biotin carboxyl carrier protein